MQYLFTVLIYGLIGAVVWLAVQFDLNLDEQAVRLLVGSGFGMAMTLGYWRLSFPTNQARPLGFTPFGLWPVFAASVFSAALLLTPAGSLYASDGYYWWTQTWVRVLGSMAVMIGGYSINLWIHRSPRVVVI